MGTDFWTLRLEYDCPLCGSHEDGRLQTHWMGGLASFLHIYEVGERLPHLRGIEAATLGQDDENSFISICGHCRAAGYWGARIHNEAVVRVWPYRWSAG